MSDIAVCNFPKLWPEAFLLWCVLFVLFVTCVQAPPCNVWIQLLRTLLEYAACRQHLLGLSSAEAASPTQLMLAQLAAGLADKLPSKACSAKPDAGMQWMQSEPVKWFGN